MKYCYHVKQGVTLFWKFYLHKTTKVKKLNDKLLFRLKLYYLLAVLQQNKYKIFNRRQLQFSDKPVR